MENDTQFSSHNWLHVWNAVTIAGLLATIQTLLPAAAAFVATGELAH